MNPEQIATCTKLHLEGKSIYEIAPQVNRSPSAVAQTLRRPDIKAKIDREANEIINRGLKPARQTLCRLAAIGNTKQSDPAMLTLSLKASQHITNIAGLSGQAPSTIINALIYQGDTHGELTQQSIHMVNRALGLPADSRDNDVIDLDITDSTDKT